MTSKKSKGNGNGKCWQGVSMTNFGLHWEKQ